ncbi:hypothetical protein JN535_08635 [Cellulosimicrobium cellulans]|uniref:glycosyltransferase family 2 protein n=1 Tax=Cellulosimicrobium cellulans TaxID=1710 RepID=UPI0019643E84|nr:hypothetical protein [Cellulosimicrobium cellulans]MBN0040228.1 hypothetical protein [Cellulosimicrobium cellulans]
MKITVDGVDYAPAAAARPRVGLGITTRNRNETVAKCLAKWRQHSPADFPIVVVDDASDEPVPGATYRFEQQAGIARAKNKCLEELEKLGVSEYFLADDDVFPIADRWWKPYVDSSEPHLMRIFEDLAGPRKLRDIKVLHDDGKHVAYTGPRGILLYANQKVLDAVGGMDPVYGLWGYEHGDWSNRIHHAGLTTWRYADVAGSADLIHSMDEHEEITRSVPAPDRAALVKRNVEIHNHRMRTGYTGYVEYRDQVDVVLTTLLTSEPDPQRGFKWEPDPGTLQAWASSIHGARAVVLADELTEPPAGAHLAPVPAVAMNVYYRRWLHIYQHLRDHPEYRFVWATDGSDVEMLNAPWDDMVPGRVYVGSEPKTYDDEWAWTNHPARVFQDFLREHRHDTMLNAGLLGGTREDVMAFAHAIVRVYYDLESERFWGNETAGPEVGDMLAFGIVAHTPHFAGRIVTGPRVHTVFRADERTPWAWWKHR